MGRKIDQATPQLAQSARPHQRACFGVPSASNHYVETLLNPFHQDRGLCRPVGKVSVGK
tara:strand:+ start:2383 stop:2559 length:177 start_codon:yes stop_codon:yes gene_type:complete